MSRVALVDLLGSQAAWWWCILWVRADHPHVALVAPAAYVAAHLALRSSRRKIAWLAAAAGALGFVADSSLAWLGLLRFQGASGPWTAPFMVSLWVAFGASLTASLSFLERRPLLVAAVFGALAGPIAYAAGERLGVLELASRAPPAIAVAWAIVLAILARVAVTAVRRPAVPA